MLIKLFNIQLQLKSRRLRIYKFFYRMAGNGKQVSVIKDGNNEASFPSSWSNSFQSSPLDYSNNCAQRCSSDVRSSYNSSFNGSHSSGSNSSNKSGFNSSHSSGFNSSNSFSFNSGHHSSGQSNSSWGKSGSSWNSSGNSGSNLMNSSRYSSCSCTVDPPLTTGNVKFSGMSLADLTQVRLSFCVQHIFHQIFSLTYLVLNNG